MSAATWQKHSGTSAYAESYEPDRRAVDGWMLLEPVFGAVYLWWDERDKTYRANFGTDLVTTSVWGEAIPVTDKRQHRKAKLLAIAIWRTS